MSKSKKPKRPVSKKVLALQSELRRRANVRDLAKRFLIVCEDDKSAPNYFRALKRHFNLSATSIEVVGSGGNSQPLQVVQRAINVSRGAAAGTSGTEPFDQVWCVIDGDYGSKIRNARAKATAKKAKLAISTPCFEYWILLHFENSAAPAAKCAVVVQLLRNRHLPKYEKGTCEFDSIMMHVRDACKRAEHLRKPRIHVLPENHNPCTEVYKLVNEILKERPSNNPK